MAAHAWCFWGFWTRYGMCFVLRRIHAVVWELWRFLGLKGCWEVVMFGLADFALNFCPISNTEPCWSSRMNIMWRFYCWVWTTGHINNMLIHREEIKMNAWSFVVHRIKAIELRCLLGSWKRKIFESELSCFNKTIRFILQSMDVKQWGCAHCRKYSPCFLVTLA